VAVAVALAIIGRVAVVASVAAVVEPLIMVMLEPVVWV
jgi:hypothetical protein